MSQVHNLARQAEKKGVLVRPESCEKCGDSELKLVKHHPDYSKPLDIEWLCIPCHKKTHRENKELRDPDGPMVRERSRKRRSQIAEKVFAAKCKWQF